MGASELVEKVSTAMAQIIPTWPDLTATLRSLDTSIWTYDCLGENLGTMDAIITGYVIRLRTAAERAQWQEDHMGLWNAEGDRHSPANGGRS
jgi:hypothetical protein